MPGLSKRILSYARGEPKLVTFLCPSRKRFDLLLKSINSICDTAHNVKSSEIVVRFDSDDLESVSRISELPFDKITIYTIIGPRYRGYHDLNKYINECCQIATGEFLFLFNDDSTIISEGWDLEIQKYTGKTIVLNPDTDDDAQMLNTFPIVSRDIVDLWGYFSLSAHNDQWISDIGRALNLEHRMSTIKIFHDRPDNPNWSGKSDTGDKDETWEEREETFPISRLEYDTKEFSVLRYNDYCKLKGYLERKR